MAWLLVVVLAALVGLLVYVLHGVWHEKVGAEALVKQYKADAQAKAVIQAERDKIASAYAALRARVKGLADIDDEKARVTADVRRITDQFNAQITAAKTAFADQQRWMTSEIARLESAIAKLRAEERALSEDAVVMEMGLYRPRFGFATSGRYRQAVDENFDRRKRMLAAKQAATCSHQWVVEGSEEKGRQHTEKFLSLMLRAFNGECDATVAKVRATNLEAMENRVRKAYDVINKLGAMQYCTISEAYLDLRIDEIRLEYEHALKLRDEREEQRAIKEELRQQAIAERELERAQQDAERDEKRFSTALERAREEYEQASASKQEAMRARIEELEAAVARAHEAKERAISRAQMTRSGHVYVISNIGSFGTNVYKIGMTRRLDPMDRVWELSDASVPFDFDVHAIIYTDDAPGLEGELHRRFAHRRINVMNERKEFFHCTIDEIVAVVRDRCGDIELTLVAEAAEFVQSEAARRGQMETCALGRQFEIPDHTSRSRVPAPSI